MQSSYSRTLAALVVAIAVVTATAAPVMGQATGHDVMIEPPATVTVGDNKVSVTVDNTDGDAALFSPIIEVPLGSSLSAPSPDPSVEVDGTTESRTYAVQNSSYRSSDALYVYGQTVPAGETRTYTFTLQVDAAGNQTLEADVRPMYNEPNNARTSTTITAAATGTLAIDVRDGTTNTPLTDADVTVDGTAHAGGDITVAASPGGHTVTATAAGTSFPTLTPAVTTFDTHNVTFTHYDSLATPRVIANTTDATVVPASPQTTVGDPGSATSARQVNVSFLLDVDDGSAVVGLDDPASVAPADQRSTTVASGTLEKITRENGTTWLTIDTDGVTTVTVAYTGYPTGDATLDNTVDAADAEAAAVAAADSTAMAAHADIDGDGEVTAIDAMFIQQYATGNRTADFGQTGGGN